MTVKYGLREPIFVEDLCEADVKELMTLLEEGRVKKFDEGVYYFPQTMRLGGKEHEISIKASVIIGEDTSPIITRSSVIYPATP